MTRLLLGSTAAGPWWTNLIMVGVIAVAAVGALSFAGGAAVGGTAASMRSRKRKERAERALADRIARKVLARMEADKHGSTPTDPHDAASDPEPKESAKGGVA